MAEAVNLDLYDCHICLENMLDKDPRVLQCLHSFCMSCLQKLVNQDQIICPTCRETTEVSKGDVTSLKANFILKQAKEHFEKVLSSKMVLCQLCRSTKADLKCQECIQLLCEGCSLKHNKVQTFAGHHLYKLCPDHAEGMITHMCTMCVKPACFNCVMTEHIEHESEVMAFKIGMERLLTECKQNEELLDEKEIQLDNLSCALQDEIQGTETFVRNVGQLHEYHLKKAAELQVLMQKAENSTAEAKKIVSCYGDQKDTLKEVKQLLSASKERLETNTVDGYSNARDNMKKVLLFDIGNQYEMPTFKVEDFLVATQICNKPINIYLPNPVLKRTFQENWSKPWRVSEVDMESIIVTDSAKNTSTILFVSDKSKEKIDQVEENGKLKDTKIYDGNIYLFYDKLIIIRDRTWHFVGNTKRIEHEITDIKVGVVISKSKFAFLCKNSVHVLDVTSMQSKMVITKLKDPKSLTLNPYRAKQMCYAVTDTDTHKVYVYDGQWNQIALLGINDITFKQPYDTAFTMDGILVADAANKRVCLFDYNGKFVKTILTADLIPKGDYVDGVVFIKPYLWIALNQPVSIQCFKVCE